MWILLINTNQYILQLSIKRFSSYYSTIHKQVIYLKELHAFTIANC